MFERDYLGFILLIFFSNYTYYNIYYVVNILKWPVAVSTSNLRKKCAYEKTSLGFNINVLKNILSTI